MFRSQLSGRVYPLRVQPVFQVVERRPRKYQNYTIDGELIETEGWEIVRELMVGPDEMKEVSRE